MSFSSKAVLVLALAPVIGLIATHPAAAQTTAVTGLTGASYDRTS